MNAELETRPYQLGDEARILELFRQSYGRDLGQQLWSWRFRDNPTGPGIIYVSWDEDVLAAHYAVTPIVLRIDGRDHVAALSGTTMTHPAYRGLGLFPKLAQTTYDHMARSGMAMVWGFPNQFSHRGLIRNLNWVDIYEVPTFRLPLSPGLSLFGPGDNVAELGEFDSRFDHLWERVKDDYQVITKRDKKYLQWRYVQHPTGQYRILAYADAEDVLGYLVFKRFHTDLQVIDILVTQDVEGATVGKQLISRAAQIALENSALALNLWLSVTHPLHHALEKLGFRNGEPITYYGGLVLQPELPAAKLYDFHNWYLTMGDSDVF
jgi:GNAT superfamily N-acetyltransferase